MPDKSRAGPVADNDEEINYTTTDLLSLLMML